jgi:hypothetical protein
MVDTGRSFWDLKPFLARVLRKNELWTASVICVPGYLFLTTDVYLKTVSCNPSYSRGRDQKDQVSKPAWANSS